MAASVTTGPTKVAGSSGSPTARDPSAASDQIDHLVVDVLVDVEPGRERTSLTGQQRRAERGAGGCRVEVGIGEHDVRRLAPQLEGQRGEVAGRRRHQRTGRGAASGEADLVHPGMSGQRRSGLGSADHDIEHALGQSGLERQLGESQHPERRQFGRLGHHGVAGGQRRSALLAHPHHRAVPRWDHGDHAVGLEPHVRERGLGGHHLTVSLSHQPA